MDYGTVKKTIISSFEESKNSHAFLVHTNNLTKCFRELLDVVKKINCMRNKSDDCDCPSCRAIDKRTSPDFLVIKPEGKEIKKDSILDLMHVFATKSTLAKYSVYIVMEADKMNIASSNKILKFLEEPEENIIGFFVTLNDEKVLPTIRSRCEHYDFYFQSDNIFDLLGITEEQYNKFFELCADLVWKLNDKPKYLLMADTKLLASNEREDLSLLFNLIKRFYIIKYEYLEKGMYVDLDYISKIVKVIKTEDIGLIIKRIKIIDEIIESLNYNVSKELTINKFFLCWE